MMRPQPDRPWEALGERLKSLIANRLTYPKTLLGLAKDRLLTEEEIQKAYACLETCLRLVEAELTIFQIQGGLEQGKHPKA